MTGIIGTGIVRAAGGITTGGITTFINTQIIPVLLLVAAIIVIWLFVSKKPAAAMGLMAGTVAGLGFMAIIANWQTLSTWVSGLLGQ